MRGAKPPLKPLGNLVSFPTSTQRVPDPPEFLTPLGKEIWAETAQVLIERHVYDDDSRQMLAAYCIQYARFLEADEKVRAEGQMVQSKKAGTIKYNPYLTQSNVAFDRAIRLASELGLTPVSRQRVKHIRMGNTAPATKFLKKVP